MAESTKRLIIFIIPNLNLQNKYADIVSHNGFKQDWAVIRWGNLNSLDE